MGGLTRQRLSLVKRIEKEEMIKGEDILILLFDTELSFEKLIEFLLDERPKLAFYKLKLKYYFFVLSRTEYFFVHAATFMNFDAY
jgi:hypothetical protein